ncbi:MAG: PorT family protein [Flavobacteriales bacterium]|nr:MAG: PorT family protein [Flavobacteriales bacterium]
MKNLVFILLASCVFAWNVEGQELHFGVKAGANFSNLKVSSDFGGGSPDGATSFFVGGLADIGFSDKFHVQPEVLYSIEGAKDADVSYLNVPVMLKYYVIGGLNIQAGPQIGFLVDAEGGTDGLKSTNFGFNFGAAYELPGGFFVDARYNLGLSDILDSGNTDPGFSGDVSLKTKGFQLGVGYRFL